MPDEPPPHDDPHTACAEQLAACEATRADLEDKWKRALADRANEEKANARAREEFAKYAAASVIRDVLPIVDAVEAAVRPSGGISNFKSQISNSASDQDDGITAIATLLHDLLTHHGIVRIPCEGKPDFTLHEIVSTRAVEGAEPGTIVEVAQQGYTMHGQCLRPARVIVAEE